MCGFLAEYTTQLLDKTAFQKLLQLSQRRGPDSQGYWTDDTQIQLGFNRLSIQDLSAAGNQPMLSPNQRYALVFNGEIYNHLVLREQLQFNAFRGSSDTETIAVALEEWGIFKTVTRLDGMFAISIYDLIEKTVTLVRDFAGIKPLFYGYKNNIVVAASQYDQVTGHPLFSKESVNQSVLKLYLQQHFVPAPFGLYTHTYQVLPGEIITFFPNGKKKHERYWELPSEDTTSLYDGKKAIQLIEETLESCVKDQLLADVPLGAFLSGGVDSPLVCAMIKRHHAKFQVFSIGSDSKVHDESQRAKQFAEALQIQQYIWNLSAKEVVRYWTEAMQCLHEPFADFSIVPTYLVSKLARKHVTVALSGDGGDELFFGYERFWSLGKNYRFQQYPSLIRKGIYGVNKYLVQSNKINSNLLYDKVSSAHMGLHSRLKTRWLNTLAPDLERIPLPEWNVYDYPNTSNERELLARMRKAEFYGMMQKTLRKVDLASMGNSLEARVPFLQKKMIDASLKIDPLLSYGNGKQKQLLKQILESTIPQVPKEEVKKGFSVPLSKWIREDLKDSFRYTLLDGNVAEFGLEKKQIERMLDSHLNASEDHKWALFTLYSLLK